MSNFICCITAMITLSSFFSNTDRNQSYLFLFAQNVYKGDKITMRRLPKGEKKYRSKTECTTYSGNKKDHNKQNSLLYHILQVFSDLNDRKLNSNSLKLKTEFVLTDIHDSRALVLLCMQKKKEINYLCRYVGDRCYVKITCLFFLLKFSNFNALYNNCQSDTLGTILYGKV